jgi:DNA-binding IclR family transcriptional regulator
MSIDEAEFPKNTAKSVTARALAVLGAFSLEQPTMTLSQLARRAGLPVATVFRLAAELEEGRFLDRDEAGVYSLGTHLWEMGLLTPVHGRLRETAMPFLLNLQYSCRETVQLAISDGVDAVYVEKLTHEVAIPLETRIGARIPLHATAVGKALLAFSPPAFIDFATSLPLKRFTPLTLTTKRALTRELTATLEQGYATSVEEYLADSTGIAAPVLVDGVVVAAIGIINYTGRRDLDVYLPELLSAAAGLADRIAALRYHEASS